MTELIGTIRSRALGNERTVWVQPPRRGASKEAIVFLDAELYRDRVGAVRMMQSLGEVNEISDAWVIFVSMHSVESRWIECPCYPPFAEFVGRELFLWLEEWIPGIAGVTSRTIIGLSYTGLAAAYVALECPSVFQRVVAQSGSFWWNDCCLVRRYAEVRPPVSTAFYLEVGSREIQQNVRHREDVLQVISQLDGVRRFRDVLLNQGKFVQYSEYDGGHEFDWWSRTLPDALRWALPTGTTT